MRFKTAELVAGNVAPEWFMGGETWTPQPELKGEPTVVIPESGTEGSLHYDARHEVWVSITTVGFGAAKIVGRTAPKMTGPYSAPFDIFEPPESRSEKPFVYAGKAHPELQTAEGVLAVTYATNSFDFWSLFKPEGQDLYWPRFVEVRLEP